jgi:hypothetical protein
MRVDLPVCQGPSNNTLFFDAASAAESVRET